MLKSGAKFVNWEENLKHFKSSRNCVELIIDFPSTNDPDNITSITPHPHSWCILTRNTNHDERSEVCRKYQIVTYRWFRAITSQMPKLNYL